MNPFILLFLLVCMTLPFYMPLVHLKMTENLMPIEVNIGFNSTCIKMSVPNIPPISTCNQVPKEISQIIPNFSTIKNLYIAGFTILGIASLLSFKKDMSDSNILFGLLISYVIYYIYLKNPGRTSRKWDKYNFKQPELDIQSKTMADNFDYDKFDKKLDEDFNRYLDTCKESVSILATTPTANPN